MVSFLQAAKIIQEFEKGSLTKQITFIERKLAGKNSSMVQEICPDLGVTTTLLQSAMIFKRNAGQINVLIHSTGILLLLPEILNKDEKIEYLSLGAGNTGRLFDLETDQRIAEFKFINWQGGSESIRQNSLFKDFFLLAEYETQKKKFLYVLDKKYPMKFLKGGRSIQSVMSRNNELWTKFQEKYGKRFAKVCEYYEQRKSEVQLIDISDITPQFHDFESTEGKE